MRSRRFYPKSAHRVPADEYVWGTGIASASANASKLTPGTVVNWVAALRFFFVKTLKRHQFRDFLPYPQDRRRLPTVLSQEEVSRLIDAAGTLFRRTLLMTLYGTGMRRAELARLKVGDIDSQRMIIRVVAGKGGKDRDLPLSPALLETLREYALSQQIGLVGTKFVGTEFVGRLTKILGEVRHDPQVVAFTLTIRL
jgi:integrase